MLDVVQSRSEPHPGISAGYPDKYCPKALIREPNERSPKELRGLFHGPHSQTIYLSFHHKWSLTANRTGARPVPLAPPAGPPVASAARHHAVPE